MASALEIVQKFFPKVTTVKDATRKQTIEVTAKDSSVSKKQNHKECALAVACKRSMHLDGVIIARRTAYLVKGTQARRFSVGGAIGRELTSFDRGAGFAEGTYQLNKPTDKLGAGGNRKPTGKGTAVPKFRHVTVNIRTSLLEE